MKAVGSLLDAFREAIHPTLMKFLRKTRKLKLEVRGKIPDAGNYIFVANHFCIDDIPTVTEVIDKHCYILVSDEDRYTFIGFELSMNGPVWVTRTDKASRRRAHRELISRLNRGQNILMFPEATWNLTEHLPMLPMNYGCVTISLETGVPIIPIYMHFEEDRCCVEILPPYHPETDKVKAIEEIRDRMAAAAWRCCERAGLQSRSDFDDEYWKENVSARYNKYRRARANPEAVKKYESQFIFRPKNQVTEQESFRFIADMPLHNRNCFLGRCKIEYLEKYRNGSTAFKSI